ncbi:glycosyl transferase [Bacteroides uniformis]|uniref:Glycosyl transferase n=2 Tax=Bacteroides uniformis TaxID=820 RepID=A0AA37JU31_BACUN|nr:glycosyl transferase [Bacteroides uniformis]GKH37636.1 glycosyl transferase [Bacteroides uniformis]
MSMDKKVSIVVPLYNMEDLVGKCLDSLVKQTYKNLEIVVVDDGSSDNSGKIADEYAAKYPQIAVLHHEVNKGISCGIINGVKKAIGEYVTLVDSDNYISELMIERLVELKESYRADIAQGEALCYIDESEIENRLKVEPAVIVLDSELNIREDFLMKRHITNNLSVKLFNKSWFDEVDIPEGRQVVDTLTMLQMVGKCKRYVCTTEPLYYAYMAPNSISRAEVTERRISDTIYANDFYISYISKNWPIFSDYPAFRTASTALWAYSNVKRSGKIKELKKKELLKKFRDDFVQNFKYAKETSYFEMMPKMQRTIWGVFYHVPAFYNLILSLRS